MSGETKIELSQEAKDIIARLGATDWLMTAVKQATDTENQLTVDAIAEKRLSGKGPYPVGDHRLGERSHQLRLRLRRNAAQVNGSAVESSIGSNVKYAAIHEFGGVIEHKPRSGSVRLRTDKQGNLKRQGLGQRLAVFAKRSHKQAREVQYTSVGYRVTMPARAPITTGVEERLPAYGAGISAAIVAGWMKSGTA